MIALEDVAVWEKLSSPYGNSEDLPALLQKLAINHDMVVAEDIVWNYIYHQGTTYENTLATLPYLIRVIKASTELPFKLSLLTDLGVVLLRITTIENIQKTFEPDNLDPAIQETIKHSFLLALKAYKILIKQYVPDVGILDEDNKRFYLIAYLVAIDELPIAEVFINYPSNDEYLSVCKNCKAETYLWNEDNRLNAYPKDPVTFPNQKCIPIQIHETPNSSIKILTEAVNLLHIHSLKPLLPYFAGQLRCHSCMVQQTVFDGVC